VPPTCIFKAMFVDVVLVAAAGPNSKVDVSIGEFPVFSETEPKDIDVVEVGVLEWSA
jgi:hypothetical protein